MPLYSLDRLQAQWVLGPWALGFSAQGLAPSGHLSHLLQLGQVTTLIYNNKIKLQADASVQTRQIPNPEFSLP